MSSRPFRSNEIVSAIPLETVDLFYALPDRPHDIMPPVLRHVLRNAGKIIRRLEFELIAHFAFPFAFICSNATFPLGMVLLDSV